MSPEEQSTPGQTCSLDVPQFPHLFKWEHYLHCLPLGRIHVVN